MRTLNHFSWHAACEMHDLACVGALALGWGYSIGFEFFVCADGHPIGGPRGRELGCDMARYAELLQGEQNIVVNLFHCRATTVGGRDHHFDTVG